MTPINSEYLTHSVSTLWCSGKHTRLASWETQVFNPVKSQLFSRYNTKLLRHFTLPWVLLNSRSQIFIVKNGWPSFYALHLEGCSHHYKISETTFVLFYHLWCLLPMLYWYLWLFKKHCYQAWTHARKVIAGLLFYIPKLWAYSLKKTFPERNK